MGSIGRPMRYRRFLELLDDNEVYVPATIARTGESAGLFKRQGGLFKNDLKGRALDEAKLRVRHSLARFSSNHQFPLEGDGYVYLPGQAPIRGWYGWRWKEAANC